MKYYITKYNKITDRITVPSFICRCGRTLNTYSHFWMYYVHCINCFGNVNFYLYIKGDFLYEVDEINDFIKSRS